jgi:hypothetical protein
MWAQYSHYCTQTKVVLKLGLKSAMGSSRSCFAILFKFDIMSEHQQRFCLRWFWNTTKDACVAYWKYNGRTSKEKVPVPRLSPQKLLGPSFPISGLVLPLRVWMWQNLFSSDIQLPRTCSAHWSQTIYGADSGEEFTATKSCRPKKKNTTQFGFRLMFISNGSTNIRISTAPQETKLS